MGALTFKKLTKPAESSFTCGVSSIDKMVMDSYFLCLLKRCYAYEVLAEGEIVAYYRIELKRFDNSEFDPPLEEYSLDRYTDLYALHIQYIAVRKDLQGHRLGDAILKHIMRSIGNIVFYCPLRLVTLDAFQELTAWYKRYAFQSLTANKENPETELMFMDLISLEDLEKIQSYEE